MNIENAKEFLIEWIIKHLEHRDIILKKIETIEKNKSGFDVYVKSKDKEQFIVCVPLIENIKEVLSKFEDKQKNYTIITFNNSKNFKALVENWGKLIEFKFLNIFFINPFSDLDKKWIIYPHTHNEICDKDSLQRGLKSMFGMVDPIIEQEIKKF